MTRTIRSSIAGALSGLVGFLLIEPMAQDSVYGTHTQALAEAAKVFGVFSAIVAFGLILAEEIGSLQVQRIAVRSAKAAAVGGIGGLAAGFVGQAAFSFIIAASQWALGNAATAMARAVGWALVGAIVGAATGVASGSFKKTLLGLAGGFVGGGLGGLVFDPIASVYGGTTSRLIGLTCVGLTTGLAVALIEEIAKRAWIIVLAGRNEGKQYILTKKTTTIGRDEMADIPLFGDPGVAKLQATVEASPGGYYLRDAGCSTINNQPPTQKPLIDGDLISIGKFSLSFRTKGVPRASQSQAPPIPIPMAQAKPVAPRLSVAAGPYVGRKFDLSGYSVSIGREPSNSISLEQDPGVSRRHAELRYENGRYVVRDLGSTNGTFVNGSRVTESELRPGDTLQVGATSLTLIFE